METRDVAEVVAAWLMAARPEDYPWEVKAEHATGGMERPFTVAVVTPGEILHPKLKRYELLLRGEYLPLQAEQAGFPAGYTSLIALMQVRAQLEVLMVLLAERGMLLRVSMPGTQDEFPHDETARRIEANYTLTVELVPAVPVTPAGPVITVSGGYGRFTLNGVDYEFPVTIQD